MTISATIPRHELKTALTGLSKVIARNSTLPILHAIKLDISNTGVVATATNLDETAEYTYTDAEINGTGTIIADVNDIKPLIKGSGRDMVGFEMAQPGKATAVNTVGGQPIRTHLATLDPDEWPEQQLNIKTGPGDGFLETYRRVLPMASRDETRYILNGVCIEVGEKRTNPHTMVTTDGRRLTSVNTMSFPGITKTCILPISSFLSWAKLGVGETVEIGGDITEEHQYFMLHAGPWRFMCRSIDGTFPNYRQVIPSMDQCVNSFTLTDQDVQALRQIMPVLPGGDTSDEPVTLRGHEGNVCVVGRGVEDSEPTVVELSGGSTHEGDTKQTCVNRAFLLDALDAGFTTFAYCDDLSPLRANDGQGGVSVVMPLRGCDCVVDDKDQGGETDEQKDETSSEDEAVTTVTDPAKDTTEDAGSDNKKSAGEPKGVSRMAKTEKAEKTEDVPSPLDAVTASAEAVKLKLREAGAEVVSLLAAIKDAAREQKAQAKEVESARTALAKLKEISL